MPTNNFPASFELANLNGVNGFIINGVAAGDLIILEPPSFTTGVSLTGWTVELVGRVDNTNEVKFKFINIDDSGAAVTVGNDAYRYFWYDFT